MEIKPVYMFLTAFIVIIFGIIVIQQSASNAELIDLGTDNSSEHILANNGTANTLAQTPTSLTATRKNQTWLEFDGVDDLVDTNNISIGQFNSTGNVLSVVLFANYSDTSTHVTASKYSGASNGWILKNNGNDLRISLYNSSGDAQAITASDGTIIANEWHQYGFIIQSNGNVNLIFDGKVNKTLSNNNNFDGGGSASFKIGTRGSGTDIFNGSLDEVYVFDYQLSSKQLQAIYDESLYGNGYGKGIPIIYYHSVGGDPGADSDITISVENFTEEMDYLSDNGFETISMQNIYDWVTYGNYTMPKRPINIQFDDGWKSTLTNASNILEDRGFTATIGIITGGIQAPGVNETKLTWTQIQNLSDRGWEIASHSVTHSQMPSLSESDLQDELNNSRWHIYNNLSVLPNYFIYPSNNRTDATDGNCSLFYDMCSGNALSNFYYKHESLTNNGFTRAGITDSTLLVVQGGSCFVGHITAYPNSSLELEFNENTGTTAYDVSGNGNNGTISGATWNDDGVDVTLTEDTDYTISGNIFTLINDDLSWGRIFTSYDYQTDANSSASTIAHLTELFIAIGILAVIFIIINYYIKDYY